jgi:hypothetical protein
MMRQEIEGEDGTHTVSNQSKLGHFSENLQFSMLLPPENHPLYSNFGDMFIYEQGSIAEHICY